MAQPIAHRTKRARHEKGDPNIPRSGQLPATQQDLLNLYATPKDDQESWTQALDITPQELEDLRFDARQALRMRSGINHPVGQSQTRKTKDGTALVVCGSGEQDLQYFKLSAGLATRFNLGPVYTKVIEKYPDMFLMPVKVGGDGATLDMERMVRREVDARPDGMRRIQMGFDQSWRMLELLVTKETDKMQRDKRYWTEEGDLAYQQKVRQDVDDAAQVTRRKQPTKSIKALKDCVVEVVSEGIGGAAEGGSEDEQRALIRIRSIIRDGVKVPVQRTDLPLDADSFSLDKLYSKFRDDVAGAPREGWLACNFQGHQWTFTADRELGLALVYMHWHFEKNPDEKMEFKFEYRVGKARAGEDIPIVMR